MKLWKCDKCGKTKEINNQEGYPKDWILLKVYSKPQVRGGNSKGYHLCGKCKKIFRKINGRAKTSSRRIRR